MIVTPEIRERIIELAKGRMSRHAIARQIGGGLNPAYVASILTRARTEGHVIPYAMRGYEKRAQARRLANPPVPVARPRPEPRRQSGLVIKLDASARDYYAVAALKRACDSETLMAEVLRTVASDNMLAAVLDDGVA